jgi:hypothetical protein
MPADLARLQAPEVRSLAKPEADPLIAARGVVHRSDTLKAAFQQARSERWTPEQLAGAITPELEQALDCQPEAAVEVAQYLADEFFQIGDAVLVIDRNTGKAIARATDADMYQPSPVRREDGHLAPQLPRLNPNLEGFLVSYIFEAERDAQVRDELAARLPRSVFLTPELDPRLRAVTRAGRAQIAENVRTALPDVLDAVQGSARAFLSCFDLVTEPPPNLDALPRQTATASGRQNIVDAKAMNPRFSWDALIRARTGAGWVREMAAHLVNQAQEHAHPGRRSTVAFSLLDEEHIDGWPFWVGEPQTLRAIQQAVPENAEFPIIFPCLPAHTEAVGIMPPLVGAGAIIVHPGTYAFSTREIHGRWEMQARMEYTLYVDWSRIRYLHVTDIPVTDIPAQGIAEIL